MRTTHRGLVVSAILMLPLSWGAGCQCGKKERKKQGQAKAKKDKLQSEPDELMETTDPSASPHATPPSMSPQPADSAVTERLTGRALGYVTKGECRHGSYVYLVRQLPNGSKKKTLVGCGGVGELEVGFDGGLDDDDPDKEEAEGVGNLLAVINKKHYPSHGDHCPVDEYDYEFWGAEGKVIHTMKEEAIKGATLLAGRWLYWVWYPHGAAGAAFGLKDAKSGNKLVSDGYPLMPEFRNLQALYTSQSSESGMMATLHCADLLTMTQHKLASIPQAKDDEFTAKWVADGKIKLSGEAEATGKSFGGTYVCPGPGATTKLASLRKSTAIQPVKHRSRQLSFLHRGSALRDGCFGADETGGRAVKGWVVWKLKTGAPISSSPTVAGNHAYMGSFNGKVYAVNLVTGAVKWTYNTGGPVRSSVAVAHGAVHFGSNDKHLYALDRTSGKLRWKVAFEDTVYATPAVTRHAVYAGSLDGNLAALAWQDGRIRWKKHLGGMVWSSPLVADGVVYIGVFGKGRGQVVALNARTGQQKWRFETAGGIKSSPALANGRIFVGAYDGKIYALDAATGRQAWAVDLGGKVASTPALAGGGLFVGTLAGQVVALEQRTGKVTWRHTASKGIFSSAAARLNLLYVGTKAGNLLALDARSGVKRWALKLGWTLDSSPGIAPNGLLLVGSADGHLYAVR